MEVGGVGAGEERRGLTTRATFKACAGAGRGEWKATVLSERPALAGQSGPYKEMLFSLSQWGWDRGREGSRLPQCLSQTAIPLQSCTIVPKADWMAVMDYPTTLGA